MRFWWGALIALVLCSCGGSTSSPSYTTNSAGQVSSHYEMPADPNGSGCAIQLSGHDALAIFTSPSLQVEPACQSLIRLGASEGQLWLVTTLPAGGPSALGDSQVCSLVDGGASAVIWDSGLAQYGQEVCEELVNGGWLEQGS